MTTSPATPADETGRRSHLRRYRTEPLSGWYDRVKTAHSAKVLKLLECHLEGRPDVLEIGPGHGHFARAARAAGWSYDSIEPSDPFRAALREEGFAVTDEITPPLRRPDATYDLVYASMILENLPTHDAAGDLVAEAERVLRPGGWLVLIYPNYLTWGSFFFDEHYTHSYVTTPRRIAHLLTSQGLAVVRDEHVLGWFWAEGSFLKNALRHLVNLAMWVVHLPLVRWSCHYLGLGDLHWKVRKTLFEAVVTVARKPASSAPRRAAPT